MTMPKLKHEVPLLPDDQPGKNNLPKAVGPAANGWVQRIGIVASVVWMISAGLAVGSYDLRAADQSYSLAIDNGYQQRKVQPRLQKYVGGCIRSQTEGRD
jgi:hypothetical protein